jgi:putative SOS response-associated peptidase YedK
LNYYFFLPGFYEWKAFEDKSKQPYLIYAHQESDEVADKIGVMTEPSESESKTWPGPKPLFMAGIFSIWHASNDPGKKKPIYSYTIITR